MAYKRNLTKAELCQNICDPSNFSKICAKKRKISLDLLLQLANKLNISYDELQLHSSFNNPDQYLEVSQLFKRLRRDQNFHKIKKLYNTYKDSYEEDNLEMQQLFIWINGYHHLFINLNPLYAIDLFKKAILIKKPNFCFKQLNLELLNEQEINILYDLVLSYMVHEEITRHPNYELDYPITVCTAMIDDLSKRKLIKDFSLLPTFRTLLASIYATFHNSSLLYTYAMKGLHYCQDHLQYSAIPGLYLQLTTYEKLTGNEDKALQYFYEALFLYKTQNRPASFYRTLPYFIKNNELKVDMNKVNQLLPRPIPSLTSEDIKQEAIALKKRYNNLK